MDAAAGAAGAAAELQKIRPVVIDKKIHSKPIVYNIDEEDRKALNLHLKALNDLKIKYEEEEYLVAAMEEINNQSDLILRVALSSSVTLDGQVQYPNDLILIHRLNLKDNYAYLQEWKSSLYRLSTPRYEITKGIELWKAIIELQFPEHDFLVKPVKLRSDDAPAFVIDTNPWYRMHTEETPLRFAIYGDSIADQIELVTQTTEWLEKKGEEMARDGKKINGGNPFEEHACNMRWLRDILKMTSLHFRVLSSREIILHPQPMPKENWVLLDILYVLASKYMDHILKKTRPTCFPKYNWFSCRRNILDSQIDIPSWLDQVSYQKSSDSSASSQ
jgi:hypothetical protein